MTLLRLGPADRELFGIFHPPIGMRRSQHCVLLCSPFGQEAIRAHRAYRVLAERLARNGSAVLRFDYYGTGDAAGEDAEGDLIGWTSDILVASQELNRRATCQHTTWIGIGLGATLAALASGQAERAPDRLVLWDPVARGAAYLHHLADRHTDWLQRSYGVSASEAIGYGRDEVLGFPLSATIRRQIEELGPSCFAVARSSAFTVMSSAGQQDAHEVATALTAAGRVVDTIGLQSAIEWASEEAMNSAPVPAEALRALELTIGTSA